MEEYLDKGNYSFTFTIPDFKNVYYGIKVPYGKLTNEKQYDFLENHLQNINKFDSIQWIYENNTINNSNLHIHGFVIDTSAEEMEDFRMRFYDHPIKMTYKSCLKISDIQRTTLDIMYFQNYCNKHQHTIKYFMRVIEDKKHSQALDNHIKIDVNQGILMGPKTTNTSYDFGKRAKFILEI